MVAACPLPWPRGTPIRIHRMAEALSEHGVDVTVLTYPLGEKGGSAPYRLQRVAMGAGMDGAPGPSLKKLFYLDPLLVRGIVRLLKRERFDVLHAHHYEGLIAALTARRIAAPVPLIYDAHTLLGTELPHYRIPLPRRALGSAGMAIDRALPRRADHVVAVTARMRDWFTSTGGVAAHRISLIPNGVEHEHFAASCGTPDAGGEANHGDARPASPHNVAPRVLFAGNLAEYQRVDLLLHAFARVLHRRPGAELVVVTSSDAGPLRAAAERLGIGAAIQVRDGNYAALPARLAAADVLANPRIDCDGLPQKLLNYMAAGRPIVSFAGSSAILEHERTGLVVEDGDTAAFADAMLRLVDNPVLARRLGDAARRSVVARHGWKQVAADVAGVYEAVLARPR